MSVSSVHVQTDRTMALVAYILHLIGSVTGVLSIGALILNYFRRNDYADALASHHRFMIRTFWWTVLWLVIGWVCVQLAFMQSAVALVRLFTGVGRAEISVT